MTDILEKDFQAAVVKLAELNGWRIAHHAVSRKNLRSHTSVGVPDLLLFRHGSQPIAAELKTGSNTTTEEQREWLMLLAESGFHAAVWRPRAAPPGEKYLFRETSEGPDFGTIGRRLRAGPPTGGKR